jgi:hypothetical protein
MTTLSDAVHALASLPENMILSGGEVEVVADYPN